MASVKKRPNGRWRLRYRDLNGREHSRDYPLKKDALDERARVELALARGEEVDARARRITMEAWAEKWLAAYNVRDSTRRQAEVHLGLINKYFGDSRIATIKPSQVREWVVHLQGQGRAPGYVYALHSRLRQIMQDAVHDGLIDVNPCSRRTTPPMAKQRPYVATTHQVWQLYAEMPPNVRGSVLLGAFAGLRVSEVAGAQRPDLDVANGGVSPVQQWNGAPLKTDESMATIPVPIELCHMIADDMTSDQMSLVRNHWGRPAAPWVIERNFVEARAKVKGLPEGLRFHDLRHHYASLLIHAGLSVKEVQARMRHGSAKTTMDTYGHMWPDTEDATRAVIRVALESRADMLRAS